MRMRIYRGEEELVTAHTGEFVIAGKVPILAGLG